MKLKQFIFALVAMLLGFSVTTSAQELLVNCDYDSSTEGYGTSKFSNYSGAYAYATANGKTSATIVIEKTNTISGNCFENNHKNYSKLAVVIKDGATMGNAASKWDMTYPVTVEPGGTLTCARPKNSSVSNIHIKNTLTVGEKGSSKKAYVNFLSDSYQDCDISIRFNGKILVYNSDFYVQDLDAQGTLTIEDSDVTVDGAFASATFYPTTLTNSTITINGNQIDGGLSDFSGGTSNQLGKMTINNSTLTIKNSETKVAANVTATNSEINVENLTVNSGKTINLNEGSTLNADGEITNNGTVKIDGEVATVNGGTVSLPVAKVGDVKYGTLAEAVTAVTDDAQTVVVLRDVTENLTGAYLRGNITTENGAKVTITLTNSDWVYCPYTFVLGENVTMNVPALFYYAGGAQINGTLVVGAYYQRYAGTKLTINEPGSMTVTGETCIIRYMDGDANAGIYVVGDNNNETIGLNLAVAYFYQGMINAKDANIVAGTYWQTNETDGQGSANLVLDNSTLTVTVYDHPAKATGNSTVTLTNGSVLNAQNGGFTYGENAKISVDATSKIIGKNGEEVKFPVASVGEVKYYTLEEAFKAAKADCTIEILSDVTVDSKWDCRYTGSKFTVPVTINGNGKTIKFTVSVNDNNWNTVFRFEENATVNNLTVDISNATGAQRVISAKKSLNIDGLNIVGAARYGVIYGEGASATDLAATEIVVKNSTLGATRRAVSDNEGGKDVKSVVIEGNTFNANVYVSASESIAFNKNTVNGETDLRSYAADNVLNVQAQYNTLATDKKNYIYAKTIVAQEGFETKNPPLKVATKAELNAALAATKEGDVITLTADIDYGTDQLAITKAITLDLGGKTLTTRNAYGGMSIKGNPTVKNGTIVHASNTAAIKVWNATAFEDLVIDVQGKGDANKTIGGIVLQSGSTTRVGSIKNVTIKGAALTNGIETYNCGDATENVIGAMENVTIDAQGTGMLISAPCGTATNCSIKGGTNGIEIWIKGNYSASLDLKNSTVEGGVYAHDEFNSNPGVVNSGKLSLTADEKTTGASAADVTLTLARAENVAGVVKDVKESAEAKVNDTYYATLANAFAAAKAGDVVTVFEGTYAMPSMKAGITVEGAVNADGTPAVLLEGTLSGTLENLTLKNLHIKGGNAQRWAYAKGNLVFENVTFEATSVYALHFDGIAEGTNLTYKDCTIIGWAAMGGSPQSCVFDGCTIKGNGTYGVIRTYFDATINNCTFDVANVNTNDVYQDGIHAVEGAKVTVTQCTNANGDMKDLVNVHGASVVTVNGVEYKNVAKVDGNYYATLAEAFAAVGDGAGKTVELIADVDLAGAEWTPVTFNGVFDGKNHTISNLVVNGAGNSNQGFFAQTKNGEIKNVTFNNANVTGRLNVGVVAGTPYTSKYTNVKVTGHVEVNGMAYVGGVGGKNAYADWTDITVDVDETSYVKATSTENGTAYRTYVGGVIGFNGEGGHTFKNISSNIKVIGDVMDIGGIFGILHYGNKAENITFTGAVEAPAGATQVGGIAGVWHNEKGQTVTITNAKSEGTVKVGDVTTTGSLVGGAYNAENQSPETSGSLIIDGKEAWVGVAKIGDKPYATLAAAIAAASEDATVTMVTDVVLTEGITVPADKTITLDLNGKTLSQSKACTASYEMINNKGNLTITGNGKISFTDTSAGDPSFGWGSYTVRNEGTLVVENGTIEHLGEQSAHCIMAIFQYSGSTTINGGTISTPNYRSVRLWKGDMTINGGTFDGQVWVQAVDNSADLAIKGGTFEPNGGDASAVFVTNNEHDAGLAVTDGTFNGKIGCSDASKLAGVVIGGQFNETAKNGTNAALIAEDMMFGELVDGYYTVVDNPAYGMVAMIGDTYYATLADAIAASTPESWGSTVTLLQDITLTSTTTISKAITLDGNNHKLTVSGNGLNALTVSADKDKTVTFKNLEVACTNYGAGSITVGIYNTGKNNLVLDNVNVLSSNYGIFSSTGNIVVNNSTLKGDMYAIYSSVEADIQLNSSTLEKTKNYGAGSAIYVQESGSKLDIVKSTITAYAPQANIVAAIEIGDNNVEMNIDKNSTITIEGNNVYVVYVGDKMYNSKKITSGNYNIAAGATINKPNAMFPTIFIKDSNVQLVKDNVAPVMCFTLQDAVNDVAEGQTVQLINNLELSEVATVAKDKSVTLDLNGKTLSTALVAGSTTNHLYAIHNYGELTITDSSDAKAGKISARGNFNYGKLTLEAGTIDACDSNGGYAVNNVSGSEFIMNGGAVTASNEDGDAPTSGNYDATTVRVESGAKATINGGVINNVSDYTFAIDNAGETTINGGTFTSVHSTVGNHGTMTITGGSFANVGTINASQHVVYASAGTTTIKGGTFNGRDANKSCYTVVTEEGANVVITGGNFEEVGGSTFYGAGNVTVSGGTFFDKISDQLCALGYQAVANAEGTYGVTLTNKRDSYTIIDGQVTEFKNEHDIEVGTLTYKRTLLADNLWSPLYVPFEIPLDEEFLNKYSVAYINDVHSFDNDYNGEIDETKVELIYIKSGKLKANYPYLIRTNDVANREWTLKLQNTTLYPAEENQIKCSSVFTEYKVTGTYRPMTVAELDGALTVSTKGAWQPSSSGLKAFRLYLTMENLDGSYVVVEPNMTIRMYVRGEEGTTDIEGEEFITNGEELIFDLQGRRVLEPKKGSIYIINGKKVYYNK